MFYHYRYFIRNTIRHKLLQFESFLGLPQEKTVMLPRLFNIGDIVTWSNVKGRIVDYYWVGNRKENFLNYILFYSLVSIDDSLIAQVEAEALDGKLADTYNFLALNERHVPPLGVPPTWVYLVEDVKGMKSKYNVAKLWIQEECLEIKDSNIQDLPQSQIQFSDSIVCRLSPTLYTQLSDHIQPNFIDYLLRAKILKEKALNRRATTFYLSYGELNERIKIMLQMLKFAPKST